MRIFDRHDGLLLAGLALAGFIVFERTIQYLLQIARDVELRHGVALLPALVILTAIFLFHQTLKRQEVNTRAAAAAAEAAQARARARDLERLIGFGDALARSLSFDALREVVWRHLPRIVGERETWLFVRNGEEWEELVGSSCMTRDAIRAALSSCRSLDDGTPQLAAGSLCCPLRVGNRVVGAFGIVDGGTSDEGVRQLVAAAVPLIAIAVRNVQLFAESREHATRDRLTGCFNRPQALELLDGELRRVVRSQAPLAVIMFDVDHFKQINDEHGHLTGDAVLAAIGACLSETLRRSDHRCRYGGDEFLVILPDTPAQAAVLVAETIRRQVAALSVRAAATTLQLTASLGVAHAVPGDIDVAALVSRADAALYRAKRSGRNCVRADAATCDSAESAALEEMTVVSPLPS